MNDTFNYVRMQAVSDKMIRRFGELLDLEWQEDTPNPEGDWLPPIRETVSLTTKGVFVKATEKHADGNLIHVGDQIVLVSGKVDRDLTNIVGSIQRGFENWKISKIVPVKPGPVMLLYKIKVVQ